MLDVELLSQNQRIYDYLERIKDKRDVSKLRFWLTNGLATLGLPAGTPFYPAGLELYPDNKPFGIWSSISSVAINSVLYHGFAKFVIDYVWTHATTPDELQGLLPAKFSKKKYALLGAAFASCAILSTLDYYGMSEETKAALWNLLINVGENAIIHCASFIEAAESNNFLFHKHFFEPMSLGVRYCFSSTENVLAYKERRKFEFTLNNLYESLFTHFKKAYAGNYQRQSLEAMLQRYVRDQDPTTLYRATRQGIALAATLGTDWSLGGYFAGGYLAAINFTKKKYLDSPIAAFGNLFFVYLVNISVFKTVSSIVDSLTSIPQKGIKETLFSANWAKLYPKLWMGILTFGILFAAFSYVSSVLLVVKNFPLIGLASLVAATVWATQIVTGIFNSVKVPGFGKSIAEMIGFFNLNSEAEARPLIEVQPVNQEAQLKDKMVYDYNAEITMAQISRLPKATFLAFFLDLVIKKCPEDQQDRIIQIFSHDKLIGQAELSDFLNYRTVPNSYTVKNKSALYLGRLPESIKNDCKAIVTEISDYMRPVAPVAML